MHKKCNKCGVEKPPIDFGTGNGLTCIRCVFVLATARGPDAHNKKQCRACYDWKSPDQFHRNGTHRRRECVDCASKRKTSDYWESPEAGRERTRAWYKSNTNKSRAYTVKKTFGISLEEYNGLFEAAGYRCEVCESRPDKRTDLHLDHCHATGKIRGVLCRSCNHALGNAKDSPATLVKLADYLRKRGA